MCWSISIIHHLASLMHLQPVSLMIFSMSFNSLLSLRADTIDLFHFLETLQPFSVGLRLLTEYGASWAIPTLTSDRMISACHIISKMTCSVVLEWHIRAGLAFLGSDCNIVHLNTSQSCSIGGHENTTFSCTCSSFCMFSDSHKWIWLHWKMWTTVIG